MGKGARSRKNKEEEIRLQQEEQQKQRRAKRRKRLIATVVSVVALAALTVSITVGVLLDRGYFERRRVAMSSAHYTVDNMMMTYFLKDGYNNALKNYETYYTSYLGLDKTKPLAEQQYDEKTTWLDYFINSAQNDVKNLLLYAEAGIEAGLTLTDAEQQALDAQLVDISPSDYGKKVSAEDVRRCLELGAMASKYYKKLVDEASYTDAEVEAHFAANRTKYLLSNYKVYTLAVNPLSVEEAKAKSDELAACQTPAAFDEWVKAYLKSTGMNETDIAAALKKATVTSYAYYKEDGFSDWLFDEARKAGDTKTVSDGKDGWIVYMATSAPQRDEGKTVDVRHVLITADKYGSDDKAKAKAEELLAAWRAGEATETSFGELAKSYSADGNASKGGLYEGVKPGDMVDTFNDWCFDADRQKGDSGIVKTKFGYHIMYFVDSESTFRETIEEDMTDAELEKKFAEWEKRYPLTVNQENLQRLELAA